jgi:hypothetical protein
LTIRWPLVVFGLTLYGSLPDKGNHVVRIRNTAKDEATQLQQSVKKQASRGDNLIAELDGAIIGLLYYKVDRS